MASRLQSQRHRFSHDAAWGAMTRLSMFNFERLCGVLDYFGFQAGIWSAGCQISGICCLSSAKNSPAGWESCSLGEWGSLLQLAVSEMSKCEVGRCVLRLPPNLRLRDKSRPSGRASAQNALKHSHNLICGATFPHAIDRRSSLPL